MKDSKYVGDHFKKLKSIIEKQGRKANSEVEASKDPEAFLKKMKSPSIKNRKGIAF